MNGRVKRRKCGTHMQHTLKKATSKYKIPVRQGDFSLPGVFLFSGKRGSGKTYAALSLATYLEQQNYINRFFVISPTFDSNNIYDNIRNLNKEEDVCKDPLKFSVALNQVVDRVKEEWKKYEQNKKYIKLYEKYHKTPWAITISEDGIPEDRI